MSETVYMIVSCALTTTVLTIVVFILIEFKERIRKNIRRKSVIGKRK